MAERKQTVTYDLDAEVLAEFREKAAKNVTVNGKTGLIATEEELIEALMKFYVNGDVVQI